ncbi:hypothetical protein BG07_31 [Bacillus pseudomycoides]|nr:hypothetical protein DJ92_4916 [Bacillus pseudomycoides]AJI16312.1 hypothetical protein BG07_31 [Bacillus pseudomycoides]
MVNLQLFFVFDLDTDFKKLITYSNIFFLFS